MTFDLSVDLLFIKKDWHVDFDQQQSSFCLSDLWCSIPWPSEDLEDFLDEFHFFKTINCSDLLFQMNSMHILLYPSSMLHLSFLLVKPLKKLQIQVFLAQLRLWVVQHWETMLWFKFILMEFVILEQINEWMSGKLPERKLSFGAP